MAQIKQDNLNLHFCKCYQLHSFQFSSLMCKDLGYTPLIAQLKFRSMKKEGRRKLQFTHDVYLCKSLARNSNLLSSTQTRLCVCVSGSLLVSYAFDVVCHFPSTSFYHSDICIHSQKLIPSNTTTTRCLNKKKDLLRDPFLYFYQFVS